MSERAQVGARMRRARGMTLTVYALRVGCALLLSWPVLAELAPELARHVAAGQLGAAETARLVEAAARSGKHWLFWALGCGAGYALLSPLLALAWLCAMARTQSIAASFARAMGAYLPALALATGALVAWSVSFGAAALALAPSVARALPETTALQQTLAAAAVALPVLAGLVIATAHDLARAQLALGAQLRSALSFGLRSAAAGLIARHALIAVLVAALFAAADLAARAPLARASVVALFVLQQLLVFAATLLRGTWLATALLAAERCPTRPRS